MKTIIISKQLITYVMIKDSNYNKRNNDLDIQRVINWVMITMQIALMS